MNIFTHFASFTCVERIFRLQCEYRHEHMGLELVLNRQRPFSTDLISVDALNGCTLRICRRYFHWKPIQSYLVATILRDVGKARALISSGKMVK